MTTPQQQFPLAVELPADEPTQEANHEVDVPALPPVQPPHQALVTTSGAAPALNPMLAMIDKAIDRGAGVEMLEKLMALQERFEAGEARKAFAIAISAAKSEIPPITKSKVVDFTSAKGRTNYNYADLAAIAGVVDPVLSRHGLSYRYRSAQDVGALSITCIMSHRDGHQEETTLVAGRDESGNKNHIQAVGSTATYLQRYTLMLALGLAAAQDDDGNNPDAPEKPIDDSQYRYLLDLIEKAGTTEEKLLAFIKAKDLETLNQAQYRRAEGALRQKIRKAASDDQEKGAA